MKSDIIIDVQPKEVSIAVVENDKLVELQREKQNVAFAVGDIYLGKIKKIMPGLNAAFVDVGHPKEAFLHYRDLGASYLSVQSFLKDVEKNKGKSGDQPSWKKMKLEKDISKDGAIADILKAGDQVMVQIIKEAISTKGPRLSGELSFAGRYLVLIPFQDKVSVSQKIRSAEERARLRQLVVSIKPKNVSVIVRTSAEGVRVAELDYELRSLIKKWEDTAETLAKKPKNLLLHEETSRLLSLLRDTYNSNYKHIYINDKNVLDATKEYIELIDPGRGSIVEYYGEKAPIFDHFGITKQIKNLFGRTVTYKSGAYLIIEQTEAMHVIDVNSGNRARGSKDQEDTAIDVNLSAAEEIARQLRLRDLGGIIVVDFIDMGVAANRQKLFEYMNEVMASDRAKHSILPLSKFGLMQITRQRVRPSTTVSTKEDCPTCGGRGKIQSTLFFVEEVESNIEVLMKQENINKLDVHVHPFVAAYLTKGFLSFGSIQAKWRKKYGKGLTIVPNQSLGIVEASYIDNEKNDLSHFLEIDVKEKESDA